MTTFKVTTHGSVEEEYSSGRTFKVTHGSGLTLMEALQVLLREVLREESVTVETIHLRTSAGELISLTSEE
jgi:hypothetical protein